VAHASVATSWQLFDRKLLQSMGSVAKSLHKPKPATGQCLRHSSTTGLFITRFNSLYPLFMFISNQYLFRILVPLPASVRIRLSPKFYISHGLKTRHLKAHSSSITLTLSHLKRWLLSSLWYTPSSCHLEFH
jgi:hypothetical protein